MSQHNPRAVPSSQHIDASHDDRPVGLEHAAAHLQLLSQLVVSVIAGNAIVRQTILDLLADNDTFMGRIMMNYRQQINEMVEVAVRNALAEQSAKQQVVQRTEHVYTRFPISPLDLSIGAALGAIVGLVWLNAQPPHIGVLYVMIIFVALILGITAIAGLVSAFFHRHIAQLPNDEANTEQEEVQQ